MNLTMKDVMTANCAIPHAEILTSNHCAALARELNKMLAAPTPPNPIACHVDESCGQGSGEVDAFSLTVGVTEPVGDCGKFEASIDYGDQNEYWGARIAVYGNTPEDAEGLRDAVLAAWDGRAHVTRLQAEAVRSEKHRNELADKIVEQNTTIGAIKAEVERFKSANSSLADDLHQANIRAIAAEEMLDAGPSYADGTHPNQYAAELETEIEEAREQLELIGNLIPEEYEPNGSELDCLTAYLGDLQSELTKARELFPLTCGCCGLTDVEYRKVCHNSDCAEYAHEISVYRGWEAHQSAPAAKTWAEWQVGDTVRYVSAGGFHHARMTVDSDYLVHEAPDEHESFCVLDDDGDEIAVLVGEFRFIAPAAKGEGDE